MTGYTQPPESNSVSATMLARIFGDVTNSHKYLFFLALLENAERNLFDASVPLSTLRFFRLLQSTLKEHLSR